MFVQPIAHGANSPRIDVVDAPRSFSDFSNQTGFLQHLQMLRHCRAAYRYAACEITDGPRPLSDAPEDLAPR